MIQVYVIKFCQYFRREECISRETFKSRFLYNNGISQFQEIICHPITINFRNEIILKNKQYFPLKKSEGILLGQFYLVKNKQLDKPRTFVFTLAPTMLLCLLWPSKLPKPSQNETADKIK